MYNLCQIEQTLVNAQSFFKALAVLAIACIAEVVCDLFTASQINEIEKIVCKY